MEYMYMIFFFIIGTYFGSFYTVVGLRLPRKEKFIVSRSKCDECGHELSLFEMVPIISYFLLGRKCRYCNSKISPLSTYIELFTGLLFAVAFYSFSWSIQLLIALGIISLLIIVLVSDLNYLIIPDEILIFFSFYFIILQLIDIGVVKTIYHVGIGIFLFLVMYVIMLIGNKVLQKESMGGGDIKLMFVFGLILDPLLGVLTIFLGSLFALPMSVFLYLSNKERVVPFGPFLLIAFLFIYFTKIDYNSVISWLTL